MQSMVLLSSKIVQMMTFSFGPDKIVEPPQHRRLAKPYLSTAVQTQVMMSRNLFQIDLEVVRKCQISNQLKSNPLASRAPALKISFLSKIMLLFRDTRLLDDF